MTTAKKKKAPARKKKVAETSYKVSKTRSNAGTNDTDEEDIIAKDGIEAITKSMKGDPNKGKYDAVKISKGTGSGAVRTEPDTVSKVKPKGLGEYAHVNYPYNLGLPMGWKPLFESLSKKIRENLTFSTRFGKLHIQVPDESTMSTLVSEVEKKARGKTSVKYMAAAVSRGINESVKK
jgi:hypothetical protein